MKPLVIYHGNCQDGFSAAWAVWKAHPDWEFVPGKYNGEAPPDVTGREVYMVDFSYKRPVILELAAKAKSIQIIDHHKTAQADLVDLPNNVSVVFDMNHSGAVLTWKFFHGDSVKHRPMLLDYVEDRDLWRFKFPMTRNVSAYVFSMPYDFQTWNTIAEIFDDETMCGEACRQGQAITRQHDKDVEELCQNRFRYNIGGYNVWVANLPYTLASDSANLLAKGEPFAATFYYDGTGYVFSLRSDENGIDVSEVAKEYGGGGHKHAAGFKVPMIKLGEEAA